MRSLAVAVVLLAVGCGAPGAAHDMSLDLAVSFDMTALCTDACPAGEFYFSGNTILDDMGAPFGGCNLFPDACLDCSCLRNAFAGVCSCEVCAGGTIRESCIYPGPA